MFNLGVIQKDSATRLVVIEAGALADFHGGTPTTAAGELLVAVTGGAYFLGGLAYTEAGAVVVQDEGVAVSYVGGGFGMTADQKLCVKDGGTPAYWIAGIPFDTDGRVCITGLGPTPPPGEFGILQEIGDYILQETGDLILQES